MMNFVGLWYWRRVGRPLFRACWIGRQESVAGVALSCQIPDQRIVYRTLKWSYYRMFWTVLAFHHFEFALGRQHCQKRPGLSVDVLLKLLSCLGDARDASCAQCFGHVQFVAQHEWMQFFKSWRYRPSKRPATWNGADNWEMPAPRHRAIAEKLFGQVDELDHPRRLVQAPEDAGSAAAWPVWLVTQTGYLWSFLLVSSIFMHQLGSIDSLRFLKLITFDAHFSILCQGRTT